MEGIIVASIVMVVCIGAVLASYFIVKKIPKEQRVEVIKKFVMGAIVQAEKELGSGAGKEKLKEVEKYFEKKAPYYYKLVLDTLGEDSLDDIIELALAEVKKYFGDK